MAERGVRHSGNAHGSHGTKAGRRGPKGRQAKVLEGEESKRVHAQDARPEKGRRAGAGGPARARHTRQHAPVDEAEETMAHEATETHVRREVDDFERSGSSEYVPGESSSPMRER